MRNTPLEVKDQDLSDQDRAGLEKLENDISGG